MLPHICLKLEYNGAGFHGWQEQPRVRTIQAELSKVLETVLGEAIHGLTASGRTDAGVHAKSQICCFFVEQAVDLRRLMHSVSSLMKPELGVLAAQEVADDFHPTRDAKRKQYVYRILNRASPAVLDAGFAWHVTSALDVERMRHDAELLIGEYDFTSFRGARCNALSPVREILESEIIHKGDLIEYRVVGKGFLKQMVRNIVGTLVGLSKGNLKVKSMRDILEAKDRTKAGICAPPHGLCLEWVDYGWDIFAGSIASDKNT